MCDMRRYERISSALKCPTSMSGAFGASQDSAPHMPLSQGRVFVNGCAEGSSVTYMERIDIFRSSLRRRLSSLAASLAAFSAARRPSGVFASFFSRFFSSAATFFFRFSSALRSFSAAVEGLPSATIPPSSTAAALPVGGKAASGLPPSLVEA